MRDGDTRVSEVRGKYHNLLPCLTGAAPQEGNPRPQISTCAWEKLVGASGEGDVLGNAEQDPPDWGWLWHSDLWVSTQHAARLIAGGFLNGEQFIGICQIPLGCFLS